MSPQDPVEVLANVPAASAAEVDHAAVTAAAAQRAWHDATPAARAAALNGIAGALESRQEEFANLIMREVGKPISEARGEVARTVAIFRYYAQTAFASTGEVLSASDGRSLLYYVRAPLGVFALVTPWNFPLAIPSWKTAPALAAGNAVVLKPAPEGTATALLLHEVAATFLPADVFAVLPGGATTGRLLIDHSAVRGVSFTGSASVGRAVARATAERGVRAQCEMGGANAAVILADADLPAAATMIAQASMAFAGQKCTAISRIIVQDSVYDEFRSLLIGAILELPVGDPAIATTTVGPMISDAARTRVINVAATTSGRMLCGSTAAGDRPGYFVDPIVIEIDDHHEHLAREEVFGPICALLRAETPSAALSIANTAGATLAAALYSNDLAMALRFARDVDAGLVKVNAPSTGVDFHAPFGGSKDSSFGPREQGRAALDFYAETRTILFSS